MAKAVLDAARIVDLDSFHEESRQAFGFPEFYGCNMDAWIDCLSYLRDDDAMSKFRLGPDETLQIELTHAEALRQTAPDILTELTLCVDAINERYEDYGEKPALELLLR
jgi:RNAse (barnase) inhibitor barstar